ncbi:MAG: DUF3105 domain-containing protein [Acidimicrobiales bacterium]
MRRALAVGAAFVVIALTAGCGGGDDNAGNDIEGATTTTTVDITSRVKTYVVTDRTHVQGPVDYPQKPPVGGNHAPMWQNCGFYPVPVPTERAVHSMEHGAVWITYRPSLPDQQARLLRAFAQANPYVLVSRWAEETLPASVVASAWGAQMTADSAADPAVAAFVSIYANGPQTPEKGAPCSGSASTPD